MPSTIDLRELFARFLSATDASDTIEAFQQLESTIISQSQPSNYNIEGSQPSLARYDAIKAALLPVLPYRQKTLFAVLENKISASVSLRYAQQQSTSVPRFLISGAGPCGLRAAVEASVLGYAVTVLELRDQFSRHNIIKTWRPTIYDLMSLGLGQFIPNFQPHGHPHLETRVIQLVLLKAALMLGVDVLYSTGVCGLVDPAYSLPSICGDRNGRSEWSAWSLPAECAKALIKKHHNIAQALMEDNEGAGEEPIDVEEAVAELSLTVNTSDVEHLQRQNKVDF